MTTQQAWQKVQGASGAYFEVLNDLERDWWNANLRRYREQFKFNNASDLQDLDKILAGELLSYRIANWLIRDADYEGLSIEANAEKLKRQKENADKETRQLKESLGMNRAKRQDSEAQNTADYLTQLRTRAREFGVHRDTQIAKAIDLLHEIITLVGLHDRSDEEERAHLSVNAEQILDWIRETAIPEFESIDNAFRVNQKLWIRDVSA